MEMETSRNIQSRRRAVFLDRDGTVNEVAQGLVHTSTVMGILPKGSGNGLARHLGIPMDFKKSLALIQSNRTIAMDTFLVNGMLSVNVSGRNIGGSIVHSVLRGNREVNTWASKNRAADHKVCHGVNF